MEIQKLGLVESHFADIVWEAAPLPTPELIRLCSEELEWKRTTTYTVLKKFCDRGIFKAENGIVSALISREDFYAMQSEQFVNENYQGSLPAFLAAFTKRKPISPEDAEQIHRMIDAYREKHHE